MILHLHTDSRFADYTISLFDQENQYHLVGKRYPGQSLKYVKDTQKIDHYVFGWTHAKRILKGIAPQVVVIHFMDTRWIELIRHLPDQVRVVWIFWGGDGYSLPKMREKLLDDNTAKYATQLSDGSKITKMKAELGVSSIWLPSFWKSLLFEGLRQIRTPYNGDLARLLLFKRVNYCGTFLKEDYELLQSRYDFNMKWLDARFISLEQLIGTLDSQVAHGNNILLGNSCTLENNHVDAIANCMHLELQHKQKIICPLSYGKDLGPYRDWVMKKGQEMLGDSFEPLITLMPLEQYTEILKSCGYAVMYHNRQQAFNSILALLYLGVKVYLKPKNSIYSFLKRVGCHVYSTDELRHHSRLSPLEASKVSANRALLRKEFSKEQILKSARHLVALSEE